MDEGKNFRRCGTVWGREIHTAQRHAARSEIANSDRGCAERRQTHDRLNPIFKLDIGGFIADTAGIRELNLLEIDPGMMDRYFPEIRSLQEDCARNPCTHRHEKDCAVKAALRDGRIANSRYQSYLELR